MISTVVLVMEFRKKNDMNETKNWKRLVREVADHLKIELVEEETEEGIVAVVSEKNKDLIQDMLYYVDHEKISLNYIYEGRMRYVD